MDKENEPRITINKSINARIDVDTMKLKSLTNSFVEMLKISVDTRMERDYCAPKMDEEENL